MLRWFLCVSVICAHAVAVPRFRVESRRLVWPREVLKNRSAGPGGTITMPWVASTDTRLASRINESLYLEILGAAPPRSSRDTFDLRKSLEADVTHSVSFVTVRNDERVLAIDISRETCGAYCEGDSRELSFDARTGRHLRLRELVTFEGLKQLGMAMTTERKRRYSAEIAVLKAALSARASSPTGGASAATNTPRDEDDLEERLQFNQECLAREEREPVDVHPESSILWDHFSLPKSGAMVLVSARCSNHAMRAIDDVGNVSLTVPQAELAPLLSAYGMAVVFGRGAGTETSIWGQVLHGFVGKSPVTFRLDVYYNDGSLRGIYYYDKYRTPIEIHGNGDGTRLTLSEDTASSSASFDLSLSSDRLVGRWHEGDRVLPVNLE